jgi:hypothetical protein
MKDDVNHTRSSTKLSSDYYINDPRPQNQDQNLRPKGIPEQNLVDTLQLGLAALKIIENCQHCKDRLKEKYGGISESNQILLESKRYELFETTIRK